jgi:hypothetical protein
MAAVQEALCAAERVFGEQFGEQIERNWDEVRSRDRGIAFMATDRETGPKE